MGEEVRIDDSIADWEAGLPSTDDLTPLTQSLIPAELASAFKISPEPLRTVLDVNQASQSTLSSLRGGGGTNFKAFVGGDHEMSELEPEDGSGSGSGSGSKKTRRTDPTGDDPTMENNCGGDDQSTAGAAKTLKRPRLVWTPHLHRRFVEVVTHLGVKNAVPKTIMQMMNVEGLTRENVASHLQKYRLYVKRMEGVSNEGPSPSDHLFASTPVPLQSFNESSSGAVAAQVTNGSHSNGNSRGNSHAGMPISMPYPNQPQIMPMSIMGHGFHSYDAAAQSHHYQQQHYNTMVQQQRDWSGNKVNGYSHHVAQSNNKC